MHLTDMSEIASTCAAMLWQTCRIAGGGNQAGRERALLALLQPVLQLISRDGGRQGGRLSHPALNRAGDLHKAFASGKHPTLFEMQLQQQMYVHASAEQPMQNGCSLTGPKKAGSVSVPAITGVQSVRRCTWALAAATMASSLVMVAAMMTSGPAQLGSSFTASPATCSASRAPYEGNTRSSSPKHSWHAHADLADANARLRSEAFLSVLHQPELNAIPEVTSTTALEGSA